MQLLDNIMKSQPILTNDEINGLRSLATALPAADNGSTLDIGDQSFATALAIVILAGLEALNAG